jgi:hypothetical protein
LLVLVLLSPCASLYAQPAAPVSAAMPATDAENLNAATTATQRDPNGPSADGLYWFEVELTVFRSQYGGDTYSERPVPQKNNLRYFPQLQALQNPLDVYRFPFPPTTDSSALILQGLPRTGPAELEPTAPQFAMPLVVVNEGPLFSPAQPDAFKLLDYERDPYIRLASRYSRFGALLAKLESSGEHSVLWHQVWRQPIRNRTQTAAIYIEGGKEAGDHHELEGSVRLTGQGNAATLDISLWLSSFSQEAPQQVDVWNLPEKPQLLAPAPPPVDAVAQTANLGDVNLADVSSPVPPASWFASQIWHMNQTRELQASALNYVDHPALGMLVEIRPYLVPEMVAPLADPATPTKADFE